MEMFKNRTISGIYDIYNNNLDCYDRPLTHSPNKHLDTRWQWNRARISTTTKKRFFSDLCACVCVFVWNGYNFIDDYYAHSHAGIFDFETRFPFSWHFDK